MGSIFVSKKLNPCNTLSTTPHSRDAPELKSMEFIQNKNGSLFKVAPDEYEYLIDLIRESNPKEDNKQLKPYTQENFLNEVYMSKKLYQAALALAKQEEHHLARSTWRRSRHSPLRD